MKMLIDTHLASAHTMGSGLLYPAETHFDKNFKTGDFLNAIFSRRQMAKMHPLSVYIQFPSEKEGGITSLFFEYLKREINAQSYLFMGMNRLARLHLQGDANDQHIGLIADLYRHIKDRFVVDKAFAVTSIELNAAAVNVSTLKKVRQCGFNHITLVVDHLQHDAVSVLSHELLSFDAVSIKITKEQMYLSSERMMMLIDEITAVSPQQIVIEGFLSALSFNEISALQDKSVETKLGMFQRWIDAFEVREYVHLGMGCWVKKTDPLVTAQKEGRLNWSCYGYSTELNDIVSFGLAAVSNICGVYSKNAETIDEYYQRIEDQNLPIVKGLRLKTTDLLRRSIIYKLLCEGELSISFIELTYPIVFSSYFAKELAQLKELESFDYVKINDDSIIVSDKGKLVIYTICQIFDTY